MHRFPLPILALLITPAICPAKKNADLRPTLATPSGIVLQESFDSGSLGEEKWAIAKGAWTVIDGALEGKELASDEHAAVCTLKRKNRNSIVKFSFQLDGTKGFNFSLNHSKGHLFRVIVNPTSLTVRTDVDKRNPQSKSELIGTAKGSFEQGEWYTMLVEIKGDEVVAITDNGLTVRGRHASLDTDKPNYRFVMRGESLLLDDVTVWNVAD